MVGVMVEFKTHDLRKKKIEKEPVKAELPAKPDDKSGSLTALTDKPAQIIPTEQIKRDLRPWKPQEKAPDTPPADVNPELNGTPLDEPLPDLDVIETESKIDIPEPVIVPLTDQKPAPVSKSRTASRKKPVKRTVPKVDPTPRVTTSDSPARSSKPRSKISEPVIGITCAFEHMPDRRTHTQQYFYMYRTYVTAIHEAGGIPILIPVGLEKRYTNKIVDMLDGLLLPGSIPDIDPNKYGDLPRENLGRVDPREDRTELELFNLAFNKNIPILGICRGVQIINVALDGTLYQDIPSQVRMALNHNPNMPHTEVCHRVTIENGSKLHKIIGDTEIWVNSTHHQAIKLHGKSLIVNAKAPDGVTEGLEHPTKKWVMGVQWHPELLWIKDKVQAKLFSEFIEACKS